MSRMFRPFILLLSDRTPDAKEYRISMLTQNEKSATNVEVSGLRRLLPRAEPITEELIQRHKSMERHIWTLSRAIWPYHHGWLLPLVCLLGALDHISTFVLLEISGKADVYESGFLASWALKRGGWNGLYIMDVVAVGLLCVIAGAARLYYDRVGLAAFARAAYVAVLVPYALTAFAAVVNNITLTLI